MIDLMIIIKHDSCRFFIDNEDKLMGDCWFIEEWDIKEDELCVKKGNRIVVTEAFQENYQRLLQEWVDSRKRFLVLDYTPVAATMLDELLRRGIDRADVYCVSFFHSDADTVKPVDSGYEENALGWKRWYLEAVGKFPSVHIVEIPYGFIINRNFMEGLFDLEFPHAPAARYRRVWKGSARRRVDEALSREKNMPEWLVKELNEKKKEGNEEARDE